MQTYLQRKAESHTPKPAQLKTKSNNIVVEFHQSVVNPSHPFNDSAISIFSI